MTASDEAYGPGNNRCVNAYTAYDRVQYIDSNLNATFDFINQGTCGPRSDRASVWYVTCVCVCVCVCGFDLLRFFLLLFEEALLVAPILRLPPNVRFFLVFVDVNYLHILLFPVLLSFHYNYRGTHSVHTKL